MYRHKDMHAHMKLLRLSHRQYLEQCEVHIHIGVWVTIILPPLYNVEGWDTCQQGTVHTIRIRM